MSRRAPKRDKLYAEIAAFWQSVGSKTEPFPDFCVDGDAIAQLHLHAEKDKTIDLSSSKRALALCGEWLQSDELEEQGSALKSAAKAELTMIGRPARAAQSHPK